MLGQSGGYGVPADGSPPGFFYIRLWEDRAGVHGETVRIPYGSSEKTRQSLSVSERVMRTALVQLDSLLSAPPPRTTKNARVICGDLVRYDARLWTEGQLRAGATTADCGEEGEGLAARDAILVGTFGRLLGVRR